jgi:hypothetical protein
LVIRPTVTPSRPCFHPPVAQAAFSIIPSDPDRQPELGLLWPIHSSPTSAVHSLPTWGFPAVEPAASTGPTEPAAVVGAASAVRDRLAAARRHLRYMVAPKAAARLRHQSMAALPAAARLRPPSMAVLPAAARLRRRHPLPRRYPPRRQHRHLHAMRAGAVSVPRHRSVGLSVVGQAAEDWVAGAWVAAGHPSSAHSAPHP